MGYLETGTMQFVPYLPIIFLSGLISVYFIFKMWAHRKDGGSSAFIVMMIGIVIWIFSYAAELTLTSLWAKIALSMTAYIGIVTIPTAFLLFVFDYTGRTQWLQPQRLPYFLIMPIFTLVMVITNPLHSWHWSNIQLEVVNGFAIGTFEYGILFWLHTAYSYVILLLASALLIRTFMNADTLYRRQVQIMLLSTFFPWLANIVYIFELPLIPSYLDITPFAFFLTGTVIAWGLYQHRLMDLVPIARSAVVDHLDEFVIVIDKDRQIIDANTAFYAYLDDEKIVGAYLNDVLSKNATLSCNDETGFLAKSSCELTIETASDIRHFQVRQYPFENTSVHLGTMIVVMQDITEIRNTNKELQLAQEQALDSAKLKSQFMATMTHELRTPLNSLLGFLQLLQENPNLSQAERQEFLGIMSVSGHHLLRLINDVLEITRLEAKHETNILRDCDLHDMLNELEKFFKQSAFTKELDFTIDVAETVPQYISVDELRLRQILINLLGNAIKFTDEGYIHLKVNMANQKLIFEVADSGIGIPQDDIDNLFVPFYQGLDERKHHRGTGLGLAISHQFATIMQGNLSVESTVNRGTIFTLDIPYIAVTETSRNSAKITNMHFKQYDPSTETKSPIRRVNISHISSQIQEDLRIAAITLNTQKAYYAIEQLQEEDEKLADQLKTLVDDFRFDVLQKLTG